MARYRQEIIRDDYFDARVAQVAVNSAFLGQWELTRALIQAISSRDGSGDAKRTLEAFLANPVAFWSPSVATASPHHLQWLALEQLCNSSHSPTEGEGADNDNALCFIQYLVEFRLLLYRAHQLQQCQQQVAAALCQHHDAIVLADQRGTPLKPVVALSASCMDFLKTILTLNPSLGHALIAKLTSGASPELVSISQTLQMLYVDVIFSILDELQQLKAETVAVSDEPTEERDLPLNTKGLLVEERESEVESQKRVVDAVGAKMETALDILSFVNPDFAPKDKTLDKLFIRLLNFSFSVAPHPESVKVFPPGKLYSCLLGQKSATLVVKLQDCEEILRQKYTSKSQPDMQAVVQSPLERCGEKWQETVFEAVHAKRHFLEDKLEQGLALIQAGNLRGLSDLLSPLELNPLKPLLLLLGWDRYPDHTTGMELLEVLWPPSPCPQPDLYSACWRLAYQVHLVEWCLQKVQLTLPHPGSGISLTQLTKASEMFQGLESHSVLYVLHHSTPLGQLDPEEVVEVLGTSPYIASHLPAMGAGQTPPLLSPFGTPLRHRSRASSPDTLLSASQLLTPPPVPPLSERSLKPTQERDISLYHAFCAIKAVADAVNAVDETDGPHQVKDVGPPHKPKVMKKKLDYGLPETNVKAEDDQELARPLDVSARSKSASSAIATPSASLLKQTEGLSSSQLFVSPLVQQVKHHLDLVRPPNFQLEVMENIFSLIFLQNSDRLAAEGEIFSPTGLSTLLQLSVATDPFLASTETVQAILHVLQGCLKPLSEEMRKIPHRAGSQGTISFGSDVSTAAIPQKSMIGDLGAIDMLVDSSIGLSQVKQRLMSLKQHISEAVWRLQLVTQQGESEAALKHMIRSVSPQLLSTDSEEEVTLVITSTSSYESENADSCGRRKDRVRTRKRKLSVHEVKKRRRAVRRVKSEVVRGFHSQKEASRSSTPQTVLRSLPASMSTPKVSTPGRLMPGLSRSVSLHSSFRRSTRSNLAKETKKTDHDSGKEGDVEETHIPLRRCESSRRKKRSWKGSGTSTPVVSRSSRKRLHEARRQSVVARMLASPGSLLRSCIFHGNYARANEVLKLKMATGQFGKTLVQFVEGYPKVSQQLVRESHQWHRRRGQMHQSQRGAVSGTAESASAALSAAIQSAIHAASSVLVPMEGLHRLLALPGLNDILYFGDAQLEMAAKNSPYVCGLDKCVSGLIVLDLTCCSAVSGQLVQRLIWMAQQCFRVGLSSNESHSLAIQEQMAVSLSGKPSLESTWEAKSSIGPASLIRKLASFATNKLFQDEGEKQVRAPYDLFRNSLLLFDLDYLMAWSRFFKSYCTARKEVDLSLMSLKRPPGAMGPHDEDASSRYALTVKTLTTVLDEQPHLVGSREQGAEQTAAASQSSVTKGGEMNLLSRFNLYLSRLAAIVVLSDKGSESLLQLLNELPSTLVGRLLFEGDVSPSLLKESLHPLGINVIEVALQCCCTVLTVKSGETVKGGAGGVVSLNSAGGNDQADEEGWKHPDPCQLSYDLLTHVVQVLQDKRSVNGLKELRDFASNSAVQDAFQNAKQFQNVDLTLLDTSEKKTCFYSNVTNMAYLHALVWYAAVGMPLEEQLGVSTEYLQLAQSVGTGGLDVFSHFGLTAHCGYTIGQLGTVSCIHLHKTVLLMGTDHPKVAEGCSLPFFTNLSPKDPLRAFFPDTVDSRVQAIISDGWTSSPFPKPLLPVILEQSLSSAQENTSHKTPQPQRTLGYCMSSTAVETEAATKTSVLPSPSTPYELTSTVLTCVEQESELLASFTKLLCGEPRERGASPGSGESKAKKDVIAQTMPSPRRTDKAASTAVSRAFVGTSKGRMTEQQHRAARATSLAGTDVAGNRKCVFPVKETELPHSWYNVDIPVEFQNFPWMQRFLQMRVIPFSQFDKAPSEEEELGPTVQKSQFLRSLYRKQQPIPSKALAHEDLQVSRKVALLPPGHPELQRTCCEVFVHVLRRGRPLDALHLLWTEPFSGASMHPTQRGLKDLAARMAFLELVEQQKKQQSPSGSVMLRYKFPEAFEVMMRPVQLLRYMEDATTAAQMVLATLEYWSVHSNLEMLTYCLSHISPVSELYPVLQKHLERMTVYRQILHLVDPTSPGVKSANSVVSSLTSPYSFIGDEGEGDQSPKWTCWQEVKTATREDPSRLLEAILTRGCFELARQWARVDVLDKRVHHDIEVRYILTVLESEGMDTAMLCKILNSCTTVKAEQLQICEVVLSCFSSTSPVTATQPVLQYMVSKLSDSLTAPCLEDCKKRATGIKVLLGMPESARNSYQRLVGEPCLLVEQLLVDAKFDWAGCAVATLRHEGTCASSAVSGDSPFQDLLPHAELALDHLDEILMFYAMKAMELPPVPDVRPATPGTPAPGPQPRMHRRTSSNQSQFDTSTFEASIGADSWRPPNRIPKQRQWVRDGEAEKCMACKKVVFGTFNRRHHCRRCGEVVCSKCSSYSLPIEGHSSQQRACLRCYQYESRNHSAGTGDVDFEVHSEVHPMLACGSHEQWSLLPNEPILNHKTRTEFYFEKSPNIDLFLSILEFHSSLASCAEFIIHQVEKISLSIISDSSGHVHRELDHTFITALMKQLLLKAKLKFAQCMDSVGVELCDTYLSRVDVLSILVSTRCKFTPSLQDLAKPDIARRVRNRLVQDDHFSLAMEVSTKCQVDISSVWAAWGMACLKTGNFKAAKEKFHTCFKMSTTKASSLQRVEVVNSIVTFLESNPLVSTLAAENNWGSMAQSGAVLFEPQSRQSEGCWLDTTRQQECHYYLQTYGTQLQHIHFLWRHGFLEAACKLIIDEGLPTDVFLEGLYVPCLKNGTIQKLEGIMLTRDSSLHVWEPHLLAACRYFNSRSLFHILYHIQLFMKDYIRAAQTCIKFYTGQDGRKTKVIDLVLRKEYLNCAIKHLETALQPKQASREMSASSVKKVASMEVQTWMDTIHLQLQLIDFLDYQISAVSANVSLSVSQGPSIPHREQLPLTLFGSGQARAALACTAVLADPGLKDGFSLAAKIIRTFHLPTEDVLCHMAKALVLAERYTDMKDLLVLVQSSEICPESSNDKIIISAVKVLSQHTKDVKHIDRLISLLTDDRNKIQAYIQCGKLKSAYLVAVNRKMADEVRNISRVASQAGQVNIRDICDRWLQQSAAKSDTEGPERPHPSRTVPSKRN